MMQTMWTFPNPIYVYMKKHFCPGCGARMRVVRVSRVVDSDTLAARDFDFDMGDGRMRGRVKFIWEEFECPGCGCLMSINKMKSYEAKTRGRD